MKPTRICSIEGCDNPHRARGWCAAHYARWKNHGDPLAEVHTPSPEQCSVDGCENPCVARGYCNGHYVRWKRSGDAGADLIAQHRSPDRNPEAAFAARTQIEGECLIWTGWKDRDGYGAIRVAGKHLAAHRYAWERAHGPIPEGMMVDHICHNPGCVNVHHLRLATRAQNGANRKGLTRNGSASGVRNVQRSGKRWAVQIRHNGRRYRFGTYSTIDEARVAAERARAELFGDYAGLG